MRKTMTVLAAAFMLSGLAVAPAQAAAGEHPGCKGIDQASSKANAKGKAALAVVSEKFGCGTVVPDPAPDPVACPAGQTSLARSTYTGTLTGPVEWGYPTWVGGWTHTAGTGAAVTYGDGGGFYWTEVTPEAVQSIVLRSVTGESVVVTDVAEVLDTEGNVLTAAWALDPRNAISQNWFEVTSGINLVNLCGVLAAA